MDANDILRGDGTGQNGLLLEERDHPGVRSVFGTDDLDGDGYSQGSVDGLEYASHAAVADFLDDRIAIGKDISGREALPIRLGHNGGKPGGQSLRDIPDGRPAVRTGFGFCRYGR